MKALIRLVAGALLACSLTASAGQWVKGNGYGVNHGGYPWGFVWDDNHAEFLATGFMKQQFPGGNYWWGWDGYNNGWQGPHQVLSTSDIVVVVVSYLGPPWANWSAYSADRAALYGEPWNGTPMVSGMPPTHKDWAVFVWKGRHGGFWLVDSGVGTPPTSVSQAEYYATPFF